MNLIAIDIGNSNISIGLFNKDQLTQTHNICVTQTNTLNETITDMHQMCRIKSNEPKTIPVVVSSVNNEILEKVEQAVTQSLDQNVLLIGRDVPLNIKIAVENPETIGSDRLLTAAAAYDVVEAAVVIADFGTATTIDCVNDLGIFLGGVIMPGLNIAAKSLHQYTTSLPEVPIELPQSEYGINTVSAIQNGIYYAALGALREIVERYATKLGKWPQVVATGGYCKLIAQKSELIDSLVPDLCLNGLYLAYKKFLLNQQAKQFQ